MIDARRYAKLGGTRAEQTASIGSDFASVTGKQTNSSTPELRLGIDPEGGVQSAPRDFFHSCAARGSPSHDRARYARPCRLYVAGTILRYQITRLQSLADDATSTDVTSNKWLRAKPIHPSIRALLEIPISSLATIFTIPTILSLFEASFRPAIAHGYK